jgi:hypothetical protein
MGAAEPPLGMAGFQAPMSGRSRALNDSCQPVKGPVPYRRSIPLVEPRTLAARQVSFRRETPRVTGRLRSGRAIEIGLGVTLALASGCTPIATQRFSEYDQAVSRYQAQSDEAIDQVQRVARAGFTSSSPLSEQLTFDQVVLTWESEGDPTQPQADAKPLHVQLRELRRGVSSLNDGLTEYAGMLAALAGSVLAHSSSGIPTPADVRAPQVPWPATPRAAA